MSGASLRLSAADLERIVGHCRRELPREACGLLSGAGGAVAAVHPARNALGSAERYALEPGELFRALDEIGRAGRELVGVYHSHPGGPAAPSRTDLEGALWPGTAEPNYPGAVQLIVSLRDRAAPEVRGYALVGGAFVEVPVVVS